MNTRDLWYFYKYIKATSTKENTHLVFFIYIQKTSWIETGKYGRERERSPREFLTFFFSFLVYVFYHVSPWHKENEMHAYYYSFTFPFTYY